MTDHLDPTLSPDPLEPAPEEAEATDFPEDPSPAFLEVPEPLRAPLVARGFTGLTPVQQAVLAAEPGRDLQLSSQTGSGKTVALGILLSGGLCEGRAGTGPDALILVPTRELATQVREELRWLYAGLQGVRVASVTGGTPLSGDRHQLAQRPRVLVGTPGRMLDLVRSGTLDLSAVRELVLDEADQMLDMGFREELEGILDATPVERRTHMVSATVPDGIRRLAERYQRDPLAVEGTPLGDAHQDIDHVAHVVLPQERYAALVNLLLLAGDERTLVFVERRADTLRVAERLEADGFAALPLSGELIQSQRDRTLAAFRAGRATVLVATDVAARGLDVPDVTTVIQTSPPLDSEVYVHRAGRTGRAGNRGRSVLFTPPQQRRRANALLADAGVELTWLPLPDADEVRRVLAERERAALAQEMDAALASGPDPETLEQAAELLRGREPEQVVAALLARQRPARRARPMELSCPRREDHPRAPERPEHPHAPRTAPRRVPTGAGAGGMQRFFTNWGANQGATPGRLLATLCRRGGVTGNDIGSIAIHPNASTFDVRLEVAERFERRAARRDARDPHTVIRRDRGPHAGAGTGWAPGGTGGHSGYSGHSGAGPRRRRGAHHAGPR